MCAFSQWLAFRFHWSTRTNEIQPWTHPHLSLVSPDKNPLFSWMMYLFSWTHVSISIRIILLPEDTWKWWAMLRTGNAKWKVSVTNWNYRNNNSTNNHRNLMEIVYQLNLSGQQMEAKGGEKSVNEACLEWPWCFADITLEKVKSNINKCPSTFVHMSVNGFEWRNRVEMSPKSL